MTRIYSSKIVMFEKCRMAYYLKYCMYLKSKARSKSIERGLILHRIAHHAYKETLNDPLKVGSVLFRMEEFLNELEGNSIHALAQISPEYADSILPMAQALCSAIPFSEVKQFEETVNAIHDGVLLSIKPDFVSLQHSRKSCPPYIINDIKTTSTYSNKIVADYYHKIQPWFYLWVWKKAYPDIPIGKCFLYVVPKPLKHPKPDRKGTYIEEIEIDEATTEKWGVYFETVINKIREVMQTWHNFGILEGVEYPDEKFTRLMSRSQCVTAYGHCEYLELCNAEWKHSKWQALANAMFTIENPELHLEES